MIVSTLTNAYDTYIPTTSSQYKNNVPSNTLDSQNTENTTKTEEKFSKTQEIQSSYKENSDNTLTNVSNDNFQTSYFTGEEILVAMQEKDKQYATKLTEEEQKQVEELKLRDKEVKAHEQAHISAGGSYVKGGARYDYQTGADGRQYAVGGSVSIDTSPIHNDPKATIAKAQVVIKAALAPAEPSTQDQQVASKARQMISEANKELNSQKNINNNQVESSPSSSISATTLLPQNLKNMGTLSNIGSLISLIA